MQRAFETSADPALKLKSLLLAIPFAIATVVIGYDVAVYSGGPSQADKAQAERARPQLEQGATAARARFAHEHDADLAELRKELGPQPESRCYGFHRRRLRNVIERYVHGRVIAAQEARRDPLNADLPKLYDTPEDAGAMREAEAVLRLGFLLPREFPDWTESDNALLPLPVGVEPKCSRPMEEAEKDSPG